MNESTIFEHVNELAAEEERLYASAAGGRGLDPDEIARLDAIKVELDQCYDLLHQREARRGAGLDPDDAALRPAAIVEHYQQ